MAITQEVNVDLVEKLADGNLKIKYPKTKVSQVVGLDIATKEEAEAGSSNVKYMTALRVKEAIAHAKVVTGTYTGNLSVGSKGVFTPRTISLGFTPSVVFVIRSDGVTKFESSFGTSYYGGLALPSNPVKAGIQPVIEIASGGFTVWNGTIQPDGNDSYIRANNSGTTYYYIAFK